MTIQQYYPNSRPSLNLNFALSTKLDPVVTFSRTTSGTQINRNGFIESVPADTARFDHDPVTLEPRGLLVEGGRTNRCTQSSNFSFSSTNNVTETDVFNPDGTPAIRRVPLSSGNFHGTEGDAANIDISSQAVGGTTDVTTSIFVRNYNNSNLGLLIGFVAVDATPTYRYLLGTINTANPTVLPTTSSATGWSNGFTQVQDYGNGWYRYTFGGRYTKAAGFNTITFVGEQIFSSTGQQFWNGDNVSGIYIWGRQREIGAFSTSYIPTSGSEGVRGSDTPTIEGNDFTKWFNQTEGTIFADMGPYVSEDTGNFGISIGSASNNYLAFPYIGGSGTYARTTYWREPSITATSQPLTTGNTAGKYAIAYKNSQRLDQAFNGTLGTFGGSLPSPTGYDSLYIFRSHFTPGERQNFYLKRLVYYPSALANAILQTITK